MYAGQRAGDLLRDLEGGGQGEGFVARERRLVFSEEHGEGFVVLAGLAAGDLLITAPLDRLAEGIAVRRKGSAPAGPERD